MKRILVTTDLSEESQVAFEPARELAQAFDGTVELLAVIEDPAQAALMYALDFPVLPGPEVQEQLREKVRSDLNQYVEKFFKGIKVKAHIKEADEPVHSAIIHFAEEHDCTLTIIATHGRTGISRLLIGSVAERVVRESTRPVLTIPSPKNSNTPE